MAGKRRVLVLYASETGNTEDASSRVRRELEARDVNVSMVSMDAFEVSSLATEKDVVLLTSTHGQGDPPVPMRAFWRVLLRRSLPPDSLCGVRIAVFGLGDSGYARYNTAAKKLFRRLLQLGARAVAPLGLGDEQAAGGYDVALDAWLVDLFRGMGLPIEIEDAKRRLGQTRVDASVISEHPQRAPADAGVVEHAGAEKEAHSRRRDDSDSAASLGERGAWKWTIQEACCAAAQYRELKEEEGFDVARFESRPRGFGGDALSSGSGGAQAADGQLCYSWRRPLEARVLEKRELSSLSDRRVLHVAFGLEKDSVFEPGDLLSILPLQDPEDVARLCERLGHHTDAVVRLCPSHAIATTNIRPADAHHRDASWPRVRLGALIDGLVDVNSGSPRRFFFQMLAQFTDSEVERERLEYFATDADGREDLFRYNERERRTLLEVLDDFPGARPPLSWLLHAAPMLKPRLFSISSSLRVHPQEAHVTAALVAVKTPYKRQREGLCSALLSRCKVGDIVPVWIQKGALRVPEGDSPLILVGPGTGVAPFRSFIQHIDGGIDSMGYSSTAAPAEAPSHRRLVLFFGCRTRGGDYLYGAEWEARASRGGLDLHTAFSREDPLGKKTYVTQRIRDAGREVWDLISRQGAHVFVSGSSTRMPEDVHDEFVRIVQEHGSVQGREGALAWMKTMEANGRYTVESWS